MTFISNFFYKKNKLCTKPLAAADRILKLPKIINTLQSDRGTIHHFMNYSFLFNPPNDLQNNALVPFSFCKHTVKQYT